VKVGGWGRRLAGRKSAKQTQYGGRPNKINMLLLMWRGLDGISKNPIPNRRGGPMTLQELSQATIERANAAGQTLRTAPVTSHSR
jgi:hypothetical protein